MYRIQSQSAGLIILFFSSLANVVCAEVESGFVYVIENKQSHMHLNVAGGRTDPGAPIRQREPLKVKGQAFLMFRFDTSSLWMFQARSSSNPPLVITAKVPDQLLSDGIGTGSSREIIVQAINVLWLPSAPAVTSFEARAQQDAVNRQRWRLVHVEGAENTYFIESVASTDRMVLEPASIESLASVRITPFDGSESQMWIFHRISPLAPTNVSLNDFRYKFGDIEGRLTWVDKSLNEDGFEIYIDRDDEADEMIGTEGRNRTGHSFKIETSLASSKKQHCFLVRSFVDHYRRFSGSAQRVCDVPTSDTQQGFQKLAVKNCHPEKKDVRLWSRRPNTNVWKDLGKVDHQWNGNNGCPGSSLPKVFDLEDGARNQYAAIDDDCGSISPATASASCTQLTPTQFFLGDEDGTEFVLIELQ